MVLPAGAAYIIFLIADLSHLRVDLEPDPGRALPAAGVFLCLKGYIVPEHFVERFCRLLHAGRRGGWLWGWPEVVEV